MLPLCEVIFGNTRLFLAAANSSEWLGGLSSTTITCDNGDGGDDGGGGGDDGGGDGGDWSGMHTGDDGWNMYMWW